METLVDLIIRKGPATDGRGIRDGDRYISYRDFHLLTNRLARRCREKGVGSGSIVPILLTRGIDILIAVVGVLKAGGAYVPVDTGYPVQRIAYMLEDTGCSVVVGERERLPPGGKYVPIVMDGDWSGILESSAEDPPVLPSPGDLAYVIYTSGSTGNPKGVMVEHAQIHRYIMDVYERLGLAVCESYALFGTLSADAGLTAVFSALCYGKDLHIIDIKNLSAAAIIDYFRKYPVDCYKTTPSLIQTFLRQRSVDKLLPRKVLMLGGEACPWTLARHLYEFLPEGCRLFNHYGPTETTVGVLTYAFPPNPGSLPSVIPLGIPLEHTKVHILDDSGRPVMEGAAGELHIEGSLLARGYLNNPVLTEEKFVRGSPDGRDVRLYKTGDLARYLPGGNVEYLGRMDDQVKIRGYRIELKEIEHAILQTGTVEQCVVTAVERSTGERQLVGYVVPKDGFAAALLEEHLKAQLPDHMLPGKWVMLDHLPLTFNNKTDRRQLPAPDWEEMECARPETRAAGEMETALRDIWQQLLGRRGIRLDEDFFLMGGDSLLSMRLGFEAGDKLGINISPADVFEYPTIEKLAGYLTLRKGTAVSRVTIDRTDLREWETTAAQKHLFLHHKLYPKASFPHSSITFRMNGEPDAARLEAACTKIVALHESLRTVYSLKKGKVYGKVHEPFRLAPAYIRAEEESIDATIRRLTQPFDPERLPLIRIFVIHSEKTAWYLHLDMPHINSDGVSLAILIKDLTAVYNGEYVERPRPQFGDHQRRLESYRHSAGRREDELYWRQTLERPLPLLAFPRNNGVAAAGVYEGNFIVSAVPSGTMHRIDRWVLGRGLTRFQLLLAGYMALLHKISGSDTVAVMLPVHNRNDKSMEEVTGLLANVVLVRSEVSEGALTRDVMTACLAAIRKSLRHQQFPFEELYPIWQEQGRNKGLLTQSFFGWHHSRDKYRLGGTALELYIPVRHQENLPLSAAVFDTGEELVMRLSSSAGVYGISALRDVRDEYLHMLDKVMEGETALNT